LRARRAGRRASPEIASSGRIMRQPPRCVCGRRPERPAAPAPRARRSSRVSATSSAWWPGASASSDCSSQDAREEVQASVARGHFPASGRRRGAVASDARGGPRTAARRRRARLRQSASVLVRLLAQSWCRWRTVSAMPRAGTPGISRWRRATESRRGDRHAQCANRVQQAVWRRDHLRHRRPETAES
jgi:hypothetical protein